MSNVFARAIDERSYRVDCHELFHPIALKLQIILMLYDKEQLQPDHAAPTDKYYEIRSAVLGVQVVNQIHRAMQMISSAWESRGG